MTNFNLNTLLDDLEKETGLTKAASATSSEKPELSTELEGLLTKKASDEELNSIREEGRTLAKEILADLEKVAGELQNGSADQVIEELVGQTKQAEENFEMNENTINAIADRILEKLAFEGDSNTATGAEGAPVPNKIQVDNAAIVAQQDAADQDTPKGTLNQVYDAIVAKAQSMGGQPHDQVEAGGPEFAEHEAADPAAQAAADEVEKAAAVSALVESGLDFDTAADLVKQAAYELAEEEFEMFKAAAFDDLISEGYDFDTAVDMIKEASVREHWEAAKGKAKAGYNAAKGHAVAGYEKAKGYAGRAGEAVKGAYGSAKAHAGRAGAAVKGAAGHLAAEARAVPGLAHNVNLARKANGGVFNKGVGSAVKALAKNRAVQVGAGALGVAGAAGAGYAYHKHQEKKAAFEALLADGIDFDTAAALVQKTSAEIYGE